MNTHNAGYIIGAYPCAPSFHQQSEEQEAEFWKQLADTPHIRGLEQPCLENLHPFGDEWLLKHTPDEWQIVVTAVMETMRRRGETVPLAWPLPMNSSASSAWRIIAICSIKLRW